MAQETREERLAKKRAYNAEHREEKRLYDVVYYEENKEECRAYDREYNEEHREERRCAAILYRIENKEKIAIARASKYQRDKEKNVEKLAHKRIIRKDKTREYDATRYAADPECQRARVAAYRLANPEKVQEFGHSRRARKANASIRDFTAAQWTEMQAAYNHSCAYCGKRAKGHLTQDHMTPLSQGGNHTASNIIPACRSCNSRKGAKPAPTMVQPLLLLIAPPRKDAA